MSRLIQWVCLIFSLCLLMLVGMLGQWRRDEAPSMIAFINNDNFSTFLEVMLNDGTQRRILHQDYYENFALDWSDDAEWLAVRTVYPTNQVQLQKIHPNGRNLTPISEAAFPMDASIFRPEIALAPNKQSIAFTAPHTRVGIYVVSLDRSVVRRLSNLFAQFPSWSPDSEWLCFFGLPEVNFRAPTRNLYRIRADGTQLELLAEGLAPRYPPIWSADGQWIIFTHRLENKTFLSKIHPDGSGLEVLANDLHPYGNVTLSPDGNWIAFSAWENLNYDLFLIHPDGSGLRRLTDTPKFHEYAPHWSPPINTPWHRNGLLLAGIVLLSVTLFSLRRR